MLVQVPDAKAKRAWEFWCRPLAPLRFRVSSAASREGYLHHCAIHEASHLMLTPCAVLQAGLHGAARHHRQASDAQLLLRPCLLRLMPGRQDW